MRERIRREVESLRDEIVDLTSQLVRVPTENPPGSDYDVCARVLGEQLRRGGFEVEYLTASDRPEHSARFPRTNVLGHLAGEGPGPVVHLNGHLDVAPAGAGWSVDPFGGVVKDGAVWGRGSSDMKAGIASAVAAVEALRRAGARLQGRVEISGTADEESGGFAGVAWLAEQGRISRERTDYVIIPEPLGVDRVCVGHRGVYWFDVTTRGRAAHGSMPFLGKNAIEQMGVVLEAFRLELQPRLAARITQLPVIPAAARRASFNINAIDGGQPLDGPQSPCVADLCRAVFDRRFIEEEAVESVRAEIREILEAARARWPELDYELNERMLCEPVRTPANSPLIAAFEKGVREVRGRPPEIVASPGTYDHKHVTRIAGVEHCIAYGPGLLELAHQPDEHCRIDDLMAATEVIALAVADLLHARPSS